MLSGAVTLVQARMGEYVEHKHGRHVLLQLLAPDSTRYFPPAVMELMHPPKRTMMVTATSGGGAASDEVSWTGDRGE